MILFGRLRGIHRPAPGTVAVSREKLRADFLALNRPTAPFIVRECRAGDPENADLVAEWKIREPAWYAVFGEVELAHNFQVFMTLLPDRQEVQSIDWTWDMKWSGGLPSFSFSSKGSRGQQWEYRRAIRPFYETTSTGERIAYRFTSSEIKKPLQAVVAAAGWTWRSRFAGRLARDPNHGRLNVSTARTGMIRLGAAAVMFIAVGGVASAVASLVIRIADAGSDALTYAPPIVGVAAGWLAVRLRSAALPGG